MNRCPPFWILLQKTSPATSCAHAWSAPGVRIWLLFHRKFINCLLKHYDNCWSKANLSTKSCSAAGLKCRSQVTGHKSGQITGYRSGHRSDHRSHTKTIGHWTKLFLIDILLYKNKTSQGTSIIFFLFWTLPNSTHEKIYSCWSRKEDLRYSVTKVGNEIKGTQNHVICKKKRISKRMVVALRISWRVCGCFEKHSTGKQKKNLRTV